MRPLLVVLGPALSLALGAGGALAQDPPGFAPASADQRWPGAVLRVEYPGSGSLEVRQGRAVRMRDAVETVLSCTTRGGPGTIHALAQHPDGTVVVAAEHGLFLTDAERDVLDPPPARDGIPPGPPVGIAIDARGRLWLATATSFGAVETKLWFGRTFCPDDGLPNPPFRGLAVAADGALLLRAADGLFAYHPDRSPKPRGTVGGIALTASREIVGDPDGSAALELSGTAAGGATFRYRLHHHHILTSLHPPIVSGLKPGRHGIDVLAFDRDLNSALVESLTVRIPFPAAFDKRLLLPVAALAGLVVVLMFGWRARRSGGGRRAWARALLSAGLCSVLGLQLLAGVLGYGRAWPFVGFSMYTETYREGSILYKPVLLGIRADGTRREIHLWDAGLAQDGYWQLLSEMVYGDESHRHRLVDQFNERNPHDPLVGFAIEDQRTRLTRDGPVSVAPIVMVRWTKP